MDGAITEAGRRVQGNRGSGLDTGILRTIVHWKLASVEEVV